MFTVGRAAGPPTAAPDVHDNLGGVHGGWPLTHSVQPRVEEQPSCTQAQLCCATCPRQFVVCMIGSHAVQCVALQVYGGLLAQRSHLDWKRW
jgi:hypothetical protein